MIRKGEQGNADLMVFDNSGYTVEESAKKIIQMVNEEGWSVSMKTVRQNPENL